MSRELHDLREQTARTEAKPTAPPKNQRLDAWPDEAIDLLERDYGNVHPTLIVAALAPYFPGRTVTPNMVFGKANRMNLTGRPMVYERRPRGKN